LAGRLLGGCARSILFSEKFLFIVKSYIFRGSLLSVYFFSVCFSAMTTLDLALQYRTAYLFDFFWNLCWSSLVYAIVYIMNFYLALSSSCLEQILYCCHWLLFCYCLFSALIAFVYVHYYNDLVKTLLKDL